MRLKHQKRFIYSLANNNTLSGINFPQSRYQSTAQIKNARPAPPKKQKSPLAVMPTKTLFRSLMVTTVMSSPLLDPCLALVKSVAHSKAPLLDPARNPVLNYFLRATIYDHFCAGENDTEVKRTVQDMKDMGFRGVILGYAREVVVSAQHSAVEAVEEESHREAHANLVEEWKQGNLRTLKMIGAGDYLAVKFTGAGPAAVEALSRDDATPPKCIKEAIEEICEETARQGSRLWIDAEQQIFQNSIDTWTVDLMRKYNRDGAVVVFNTIQAYLKSSTGTLHKQLILAETEGWTVGIKLVRGAYIAHDIRSRIHDTKEDTDRNYDTIVEKLLTRQFPLESSFVKGFPDVRLFVASHNAESVEKAYALHRSRVLQGNPTIAIEFGQLQGMADEISCGLLAEGQKTDPSCERQRAAAPKVFKCMSWGTTSECLQFLLRRAVENKGAVQRTKHMAKALREEVWRRLLGKDWR